tara:strand:+ start:978 stop:1193 length:216 start_codon:yes stop_codon:yes gene_type:complete
MKVIREENKPEAIERMKEISLAEIKSKYSDKLIDAYAENGRLIIVLDTCRLKFDERVPQKGGSVYGAIHRK